MNAPRTIKVFVTTKRGNGFEVDLPCKRIVCSRCEGTGKHVNPNIDGHGIDPQEFIDDPEFEENYFGGLYDVTCEECKGERVLDVVDEKKLTKKMRDRYYRALDEIRACEQEAESERRMGA